MYRDAYGRLWRGPLPFTSAVIRSEAALRAPGIYLILSGTDPVYVGVSDWSIWDRLSKHERGRGNAGVARRHALNTYTFVYFLCDGLTARQIESHTLLHRKPALNDKIEYLHYIANITVH